MSGNIASRYFMGTYNNPSGSGLYEEITILESCAQIDEVYAQYERGACLHIQFCVSFVEPAPHNWDLLKSLIPKAHIEKARKPWPALVNYCRKQDSTTVDWRKYYHKSYKMVIPCPLSEMPDTVYHYPAEYKLEKSVFTQPDIPLYSEYPRRIMIDGKTHLHDFKYVWTVPGIQSQH